MKTSPVVNTAIALVVVGSLSGDAKAQQETRFVEQKTTGVSATPFVADFSRVVFGWPDGGTFAHGRDGVFTLRWRRSVSQAGFYRISQHWSTVASARATLSAQQARVDLAVSYSISGCGAATQIVTPPEGKISIVARDEPVQKDVSSNARLPYGFLFHCPQPGVIDIVIQFAVRGERLAPSGHARAQFLRVGIVGTSHWPEYMKDYVFFVDGSTPPPDCERRSGGFSWSCYRAIPDQWCVQIANPADPHSWMDNYFCSRDDIGLTWSSRAVSGKRCTRIYEDAEPAAQGWKNKYLCVSASSKIHFLWSQSGPIAGKDCIEWSEPADPDAWGDNYLCWKRPSGPSGPSGHCKKCLPGRCCGTVDSDGCCDEVCKPSSGICP